MKRLVPVLPTVLVFCLSWLFFLMLAPWGNVHRDEGWLLESSWRVSRGEIPHLDFSTIYPAGRYYLLAWWMDLTDTTLLALRTMHATLRAVTVALVWSIGRRWMPWPLALMAAMAATFVPGPWHKTLYVLVPLVVVRAWQGWLDHPSRWTAALTGVVAGIGFWFRQDTAAFAALSIGAVAGMRALRSEGRRQELEAMVAMVAGGLVTFLAGLLFFSAGPGPEIVLYEVLFAAFADGTPEAGVMAGILLGDLDRYGARGLMILTGASLAAALVTLSGLASGLTGLRHPEHRRIASQLLVMSLLYALMANQIFRGNAYTRFLQAVPPFYLLWFAGASLEATTVLDRSAAWWRRTGAALLVLVAALGPVGLFYACMPVRGQQMITPEFSGTIVTMWERDHAYSIDNITFYGDPMEMDPVLMMIHEIRKIVDAEDTVLFVPGPSMAYVISRRPNPSRFVRWVPDTPDRLEEFAEMLQSEEVEWIVVDEVFLNRASLAWRAVLSRYARKVRSIDRHEVWKVL